MITGSIVAKDFRLSAGNPGVFIMRIVLQLRRSAQHRAAEGTLEPNPVPVADFSLSSHDS
jgi:hypothetical protein